MSMQLGFFIAGFFCGVMGSAFITLSLAKKGAQEQAPAEGNGP